VQGKPEQQMGSAVVLAQEPDWNAIVQHATALLGKTKDLRVAFHLTRALLNRDGFAALRDGLVWGRPIAASVVPGHRRGFRLRASVQ